MAADPGHPIPNGIRDALTLLRKRIRIYVIAHGILLAAVWVGVTYWISLTLDYMPVLFGWSEMAVIPRAFLLIVVAVGFGWILFRWSLRRALARISDQSLALVLERRFPELEDALATSVQPSSSDASETHDELFEKTIALARDRISAIAINEVFDFRPLRRLGFLTAALAASMIVLAVWSPAMLSTSLQRLYLLRPERWERKCHIEVVGIRIDREDQFDGIPGMNDAVRFVDGRASVSKASSITLLVRAQAPSEAVGNKRRQRILPRICQLTFQTEDGNRGRLEMAKVGGVRGGYQMYSTDEQIMQSVMSDMTLYVRGGDHRIGPLTIKCVPNAIVTETLVDCDFPDYLADERTLRWSDRTVPWTRGMRLPAGTRYALQVKSNRPLASIFALDEQGTVISQLRPDASDPYQFTYRPAGEDDYRAVSFLLRDTDGLFARATHAVEIEAVQDRPPEIDSRLDGIGTAITPDAVVPIFGSVFDEYGVKELWVRIERSEHQPVDFSLPLTPELSIDSAIDFRKLRRAESNAVLLSTDPGSQISVTVMASDFYDLEDPHPLGSGDRYILDVVTANEMLRILERLEAAQRRRLEQIYEEMSDARGYLVRVHSAGRVQEVGLEPGDRQEPEPLDDPAGLANTDSDPPSRLEIQSLFNQRALMQIQKSAQEIMGVAEAFDDIRKQLVNNRVDSQDRRIRLEQTIVAPLKQIATDSMKRLEQRVVQQADVLDAVQVNQDESMVMSIDSMANQTIAEADRVLVEIQQVLDLLIKFETQNELLDIVRQMIDNQKRLMERTQEERNRQAFEGLLK